MDKGDVLQLSDPSASHKLSTQVYIWSFTVVPQTLKQRGEGSAGKPQYPLPIAGAVQEGLSLSFARAMVRENSHSLVRHDYTVLC